MSAPTRLAEHGVIPMASDLLRQAAPGPQPPQGKALTKTAGGTPYAIYYVSPDHLGTPRAITRPVDNRIVWRWDNTEPFGNSPPNGNPSGVGNFTFNLRFPGQYFDAETGTHYNYYRDYDPSIGRYIQSDPIGLAGGTNTFLYVNGRPLSLVDLFGLCESTMEVRYSDWIDASSNVEEIGGTTVRVPNYGWEISGTSVCMKLKGFYKWNFRLLQSVTFQQKFKYVRICNSCSCDGASGCTDWMNVGPVDARERRSMYWGSKEYLGYFPAADQACVNMPFPWDMPKP